MTENFDPSVIHRLRGFRTKMDSLVIHAYVVTKEFPGATVFMRVLLRDWQTERDVVICVINTWPHTERNKGYGSRALREFLEGIGTTDVIATQVQNDSFWLKNGFEPLRNETNDYVLTSKETFLPGPTPE